MLKKKYCLLLPLLAVAILMVYQSRVGPLRLPRLFNSLINSSTGMLHSVCASIEGRLPGSSLSAGEAARLKKKLAAFKLREPRLKELMLENGRLREALDLSEHLPSYVTAARVVSRGGDRWSNTFVIDKGKKDGIEKNMAAITPDGLLGKVQEVYGPHSLLLLIDDEKFSAAVRLQDDRAEAVLSGAGRGRCSLKYVESDGSIEVGQVLLTSGLDGLFPPGIAAGYVSKITTKEDSLFHDIEVTPFVEPARVEEAIVIKR